MEAGGWWKRLQDAVVFSFQGWAVDVTSDVRLLKLEQTLIARWGCFKIGAMPGTTESSTSIFQGTI
jgi:hypothetical protein